MNKVSRLITASLLAFLPAVSCTDLTEVNNKLDSLDSRVSALEKAVNSLNQNVLALSSIAQNQTINSVSQDGDTYRLTLSNGQELTIYQGTMGIGNTPVLSIDRNGYWQVDYGAGPEPVLQNGRPVYAIGQDGITPVFGVDDSNDWIVSYDNGSTWQNVLYSAGEKEGQKVRAYDENGSDSYFHDVRYDEGNGVFVLSLKNGQTYTIPVVKDFMCRILDAEDVQMFDYGETRTFTVEMGGVADYTLIAPDGWNAVLQGEGMMILKVTAPVSSTKATIADSEADVTIIAFTRSGLSTSARIEVALTGRELDRRPFTSPSRISVGTSDATVRVLVENATEWYYLLSTSPEPPHASEIIADGVRGTENIFTLTGLKQAYTYYLYTTAVMDGVLAPVARCSFKTGITNDRYQAFLDGEDIIICGVHYNLGNVPAYTLLTATGENDHSLKDAMVRGGLIFLDTPEGTSFDPAPGIDVANDHETVLVGRYSDNYAKVNVMTGRLLVNAGLAMQYVELDGTGRNGMEFFTRGLAEHIYLDSCRFYHKSGSGMLVGTESNACWSVIRMMDNDFHFVGSNGAMHLITTSTWKKIALTRELVFENNIFYCPVDTRMHLFFPGENFDKTNPPAEWNRTRVSVCSNTFFGCASDWSMLRLFVADEIGVQKNIFWFYPDSIVNQADVVDLFWDDGAAPSVVFDSNISYRGDIRGLAGNVNPSYLPGRNTVNGLSVDPLAGCDPASFDFTPISAYGKYGAQR